MNEEEFASIVRDNPQSTILIKHGADSDWIRIDVEEDLRFSVDTGSTLGDVEISVDENSRRKSREDLKLRFTDAGINRVRKTYAISRVNEEDS